jgi:CDP-diacylglycerol---glycerol-3-phosphate 3-phosphatidyltransferase
MIARGTSRCCQSLRPVLCRSSPRFARVHHRRYSIPASAASPAGSSSSAAGMLAPFTNELDRIAPSFKIHGSQIRIIKTPTDFYETLKDKIRSAKRRVFLSTLYIGKSEKELVRRAAPACAASG